MDDESTDIFESNIIERYHIRPASIPALDNLFLAQFAAYYYKDYRKENSETIDAQPEVLTDEIIEIQHSNSNSSDSSYLPKKISLMNTNETMKCRKVKAVIRYHTPSKTKQPELFFHHLLMLYYPWRDESNLLGSDHTCVSKFNEPGVQDIVEHNRASFGPDSEAVTEALEWLRNNHGTVIHLYDAINDQENAEVQLEFQDESSADEIFNEQVPSQLAANSQTTENHRPSAIAMYNQPKEISDDQLCQSVRSLNNMQRKAYNRVLSWTRNKMKNLNCLKSQNVEPIYLFITGGGAAGKSHLIKTIYHTVVKTYKYMYAPMNPEKPTVLLAAPTGVAAINIDGTTINTALALPKNTGDVLPAMSDQKKTQMRLSLCELKLIIIDEISMVGNTTLLHIHQRLKEIFDTNNSQLFAGISIIALGDLYQLPPIQRKLVFDNYANDAFNLCHPWHAFEMIELTEIVRQKNDQPFTELLNRFRTGAQTDEDICCIQSRTISSLDSNYPSDALHIWAENIPVDQHNHAKLAQILKPMFTLKATDQYPNNVNKQDIDRVLARGRSETGGLDYELHLKETARVMLTANIDISDRLINGQIGTVVKIYVNPNTQRPSIIFIKFDDDKARQNMINNSNNQYAKEHKVVPIEPILAKIKVRPNKPPSPEIQRIQFPITLAWACTVHKVQGLTMDSIVISFHLNKQRSFNYGQIYVAISHAKTLQGIYTLGKIEHKHVRANPKVHEEYERLRNVAAITMRDQQINQSESPTLLVISLLNIRSLSKHSIDIKFDSSICNSDIIAFTKTQLLPNSNDNQI